MGSMVQRYMPDGRSISTTTGPALPAGGADSGLMEMFRDAARRRMQPAPQAQPRPSRGVSTPSAGVSMPSTADPRASQNRALDHARDMATFAQARAVSGGAPMKMVSGFNINPGYMPDPNSMTGAQRQAFLPQNAGMSPGEDVDAEARRRMLNAADFGRFQESSGAGQRGTSY